MGGRAISRAGLALAIAGASALVVRVGLDAARAEPPPARGDAGLAPASGAPADPAKRVDATVRIVLTVIPSTKKATVSWGKKKLGVVAPHQPLVIQRPRDSGPLDLMVRGDGCVPVQTRAYTFADNKIAVKLTPLDQKNTLLGYREELPPDGGVPPMPTGASPDGGAR
jgi:hypothetical protein